MKYFFRPLTSEDAEPLRFWRNSQLEFLRQEKELTKKDQREYFNTKVVTQYHLKQPEQYLVGVEHNGGLVAYGGLTRLSWRDQRGEVSFLASPDVESSSEKVIIFGEFLEWIKMFAFEKISLERIFTETYSFRKAHIEVLEKSGFLFEGKLRQHVVVQGERQDSVIHGLLRSQYMQKGINK